MARVLVFDMGGVLYDFQGDRLIERTSRRTRRYRSEEVRASWPSLVHGFETGQCDEADFAAAVVKRYDLKLDSEAFIAEFRAAAVGFYEGAQELLADLSHRHRLLSLSNTNSLQWPKVLADLGTLDPFQAHYPSHVSGFHKPDQRAFQAAAAGLEPGSELCFFDDRAQNVAAARNLGWQARRVRGITATRLACRELGLLD